MRRIECGWTSRRGMRTRPLGWQGGAVVDVGSGRREGGLSRHVQQNTQKGECTTRYSWRGRSVGSEHRLNRAEWKASCKALTVCLC